MHEAPLVDVVVCTRNRSRLLAGACEAILEQDYPPDRWRLLIVDSASTDDTLAVATGLAERFPGRVDVVRQAISGHSIARNAGIVRASGEIVAFTDDDAIPVRGWLRALVETMRDSGAEAGGGPVDARIEGELPPWFLSSYLVYLAIWRPPAGTTRLTYNGYPRGVNMAFRRSCLARYGTFDPHLGLRARRQLYCEETELFLRIERGGGAVAYSPGAAVDHCVDAARLTEHWLIRRFAAQGRSEAILNWMHGGLRGLMLGSRVHFANRPAVSPEYVAAGHAGSLPGPHASPGDLALAARILTRCRRRALAGYLSRVPLAIAVVPRYRGAARPLARWTPL
jgi:glycosyltransferase involved in cell wall biosynthesis